MLVEPATKVVVPLWVDQFRWVALVVFFRCTFSTSRQMTREMNSRNSSELPKALIAQLGKRFDSELAAEFTISRHFVQKERLRRKIRAFQRVNWSPTWIRKLGQMSDTELADKMGITDSAVFAKRRSLGIPSFFPGPGQNLHWKAAYVRRLGKVPDSVLATELGVTATVVSAKRYSLGISSFGKSKGPRKPWKPTEISLLGKKPDTEMSVLSGRGRHLIRAKRESLGIPPFQIQKTIHWTSGLLKRLGTRPDAELAAELGVALKTVAIQRRGCGIPPFGRQSKKY